ncbi:hypothetical protein BH11ARM2_BH11ARM2_27050 [soil metagenome]
MSPEAEPTSNGSVAWALEATTDCVVLLDSGFRVTYVNRRTAELNGTTPETYLGRTHWEAWPASKGSEIERRYRQALATGIEAEFEHRYHEEGEIDVWLDIHAYPHEGGLAIFFRDVTETHRQRLAEQRAIEEVRRQIARYQALSETSASVVFTADEVGNLTEIPLLRGLDPNVSRTALGNGWLEAIHPDDRPPAMAAWMGAVGENRPYETEFRILMADGNYRWHVARGVRVESDTGKVEWVGSCVEIHDRRVRERILRLLGEFTEATRNHRIPEEIMSLAQRQLGESVGASRCLYGEVLEGGRRFAGVANYCVDCDDLNGLLPVSGFSSEVSQNLRAGKNLVLNDVRDGIDSVEGYEALWKAQIAAVICVPIIKDGGVVAMMAVQQTHPRRWSSDEVELVQAFAERTWSEVQRAKAEQDLQLSEQRLRRILEAATVGVVVNNTAGVFSYANPPLLRMLGYTTEEVHRGEVSWGRIQDPDRLPMDDKALAQLRVSGSCDPYETEFIRKDGSRIPVYVGAAFVPDESGSGQLGAAFVTDLSELKEAERELRALNAELDERVQERTAELVDANRELEGFTHSVSHDLRAPLRAIVSTSKILLEDAADKLAEDERSLLHRQATSAVKLGAIIDDLLKLSRISRQGLAVAEFDLSALAVEVVDELVSKEWGPLCRIEIAPDLRAVGDPKLVRFVIFNLIENACKFSPGGGKVTLGQRPDGVFYVSDQGIGFDTAYMDRLFLPFERLVTDAEFPGTGVGLANVQRIVQRHHGRVWAESAEGKGATFFFTLCP